MGGRSGEMEPVDAVEDIRITVRLSYSPTLPAPPPLQSGSCCHLSVKVEPAATKKRASPSFLISRGCTSPYCRSFSGPSGQRGWEGFQADCSFYGKPGGEFKNKVRG